ncbi:hypothetical protein [Paraburkholderia sp. SIMBA_030]|uniref:hypothetical protein n=1 Tax=Paraburkholderia sp. SIMBA_030 TaxID=3085773 RepID=UPI003977F86E
MKITASKRFGDDAVLMRLPQEVLAVLGLSFNRADMLFVRLFCRQWVFVGDPAMAGHSKSVSKPMPCASVLSLADVTSGTP